MNHAQSSHRLVRTTAPRALALAAATTLLLSLSGCGGAQTAASTAAVTSLPESATCPVSKEVFKPTADTKTVVHNGKTYYMCCGGCAGKFAANPDKYVSAADKPAKACDGSCDKTSAHDGAPCPDCAAGDDGGAAAPAAAPDAPAAAPAAPAASPDGAAADVAPASGASATQVACPVSGKTFTLTAASPHASHNGKDYVFCCGGCAKKFAANPSNFAK